MEGADKEVTKEPVAADAVLFDLGAVLIDWNPRYLYRGLFEGDEDAMERFLRDVVPPEWNREIDAGKSFTDAVAERVLLHPDQADLIAQWKDGWPQMLQESIAGTVGILTELRDKGYRLYALTNWSAETFPLARKRFGFLEWFEDIVVSGEVLLAKPDPRIFKLTIERCRLQPARTVFIDDSLQNVEAAREAGLHALHFRNPEELRHDLVKLGLLKETL
jgi:2-haloacid dehalogenase